MSIQEFISGFLGASTIEIIASLSGLLCLYLLIKRNIWCWFFGFIQVTLYVYIFYQANLLSDTGLNVIYMFLQLYGWWNWRHNQNAQEELVVERGSAILILRWALIAIVVTGILGTFMERFTDTSFAYPDAFTTVTSLVAQWLLTQRYIFNWLFWIVVDIVAIYIYLQKGLYPTVVLYFTFLIMCIFGYKSWLQQYKAQTAVNGK